MSTHRDGVFATFYTNGQATRHEVIKAGDRWLPLHSAQVFDEAERVVLDDGTVIKDRYMVQP